MSIYSMSSPTYTGVSRQALFDAAMSQPLSLTSTLVEQGKGGALESFGLGTAMRESQVPLPAPSQDAPYGFDPQGLDVPQGISPQDYLQGNWVTPDMIAKKRAEMGALSEDQYKASPYYRKDIPYDPGMTSARAEALASMDDARKVREFYAQKRPFSSFLGNLAGQALDPINYVPIAGEAVKAAAIARMGNIAGHALVGGIDAAANTAIFGIGTAGVRAQLGDDVSWQATISQIATAALIGHAFGALAGAVGGRVDAARLSEAEQRLATLRTTQEARIALNEGIDAVVRGEDVRLSPNATDPLQRVADQINPTRSADLFAPLDRQDLYASTAVGRVIDARAPHVQDFETALRNNILSADSELATRYQAAEAKFNAAQEKVAAIEEPLAARTQADAVALIDQPSADRLRAIEAELSQKPTAKRAAALEAERNTIVESLGSDQIAKAENDFRIGPQKKAKQARSALASARQEFSKVRREVDAQAAQLDVVSKLKNQVAVDTTQARTEPRSEGVKQAEASVAKPENTKALAAQFSVDPNTGAFPEETEVAQLATEGRLTPDDAMTLAQAEADYHTGSAFAEALKSVAGCLL